MRNLYFWVLALWTFSLRAQTLNDVGKIAIGFDVPDECSIETIELKDYLKNKISHWIAQAGYSTSGISSFYLIPDISIDEEDIAEGGMKNVYVISGTLYLKIIQSDGDVIFSSISLPFRDSAPKKMSAIKNGIAKLQYNKMIPLLDEAKVKILKYYELEKVNIFSQADIMTRQGNYDGAIAYLMSIPSCLTSIYQEALEKANSVLDEQVRIYNDSILTLANSYLAKHDAQMALDVLSSYQEAKNEQNIRYKNMVVKAEGLVTSAELAAAREKRQRYLDAKERQYHQWEIEEKEQNHRIAMDNQQMAYNREALASNERLTAQKIMSQERITAQQITSSERTAARQIASNERLSSQKINALKSIACTYYRNNPTKTIVVKHQY